MVSVRQFNFSYDKKSDRFILPELGCLHIGNKGAHKSLIQRTVKWIAFYGNAWLGMGDYMDSIVVSDSRRFDWETLDRELATPDEQVEWLIDKLAPIGDSCLGLLKGNHEYEIQRHHNHDYVKDLAKGIGTEVLGYSAFLRLRFARGLHRTKFDVFAHHGQTSARTKGGKINAMRKMNQIFDADVYLMGHVHDIDPDIQPFLTVDNNLNIVEKRKYYALTGGFLRGYIEDVSTYVERGMYAPTSLGSTFLEFRPEKNVFPAIQIREIPVYQREVAP